eukprot:4619825-Pyramimonas_sp.AAC.1
MFICTRLDRKGDRRQPGSLPGSLPGKGTARQPAQSNGASSWTRPPYSAQGLGHAAPQRAPSFTVERLHARSSPG